MNIRFGIAMGLALLTASTVSAATATQTYTAAVPTTVTITAPSNASISHDETDNNQAFPAQQWNVKGNTQAGVSVSFSTNQAFTHTTTSSFKRDAQLSLSEANHQGPATWTISQASDTTNYGASDGVATVAASSNGVGQANFDLAVSFITGTYGTFAAGDYAMTVTGTVTAN